MIANNDASQKTVSTKPVAYRLSRYFIGNPDSSILS